MNFLRPKNKKPFSVRNLSNKDLTRIKNCKDMQCGLSGWFSRNIFNIPNLWFEFDCKMHDVATRRGGLLLDGVDNATGFWYFLFKDIKMIIGTWDNQPILNVAFIYTAGFIYWLLATIGTIIVFGWGEYKDLDTILKEASEKR